jgi:hypothetical protein
MMQDQVVLATIANSINVRNLLSLFQGMNILIRQHRLTILKAIFIPSYDRQWIRYILVNMFLTFM